MVAYMLGMTDWLQLATYSLREHDYPHSSEGSLLPTLHINDLCMEATFFIEAKYQLLQNHKYQLVAAPKLFPIETGC